MATETNEIRMPGTPPRLVNRLMALLLRTPLLERIVGRTFALMTVTGSKTGRRYTTPVQYLEHGEELVVLSQRTRKWWRNIVTRPEIELRLEGHWVQGRARIASSSEAPAVLTHCLRVEPRLAKFYGVQRTQEGDIELTDVDRLLERIVVLIVTRQLIDVELEDTDVVMQGF